MLTYKELLFPYGLKNKNGKEVSNCPFCNGQRTLKISGILVQCKKCSFINDIDGLLKKLKVVSTQMEQVDGTVEVSQENMSPMQIRINNDTKPIFLVFNLELFNHLSTTFPKINIIFNPSSSVREIKNKILYLCSNNLNLDSVSSFYSISKLLKIIDCKQLLECKTEEELKQIVLNIDFYDPFPIHGKITSDNKNFVKYVWLLKYYAVEPKIMSPSTIEDDDFIFFFYDKYELKDIVKIINPLFSKTQNIFLFDANMITISNTVKDIFLAKKFFSVEFKNAIYRTYEHFVTDISKRETSEEIEEFFACKRLIETDMEVNSFLRLVLSKYDEIIKNTL